MERRPCIYSYDTVLLNMDYIEMNDSHRLLDEHESELTLEIICDYRVAATRIN